MTVFWRLYKRGRWKANGQEENQEGRCWIYLWSKRTRRSVTRSWRKEQRAGSDGIIVSRTCFRAEHERKRSFFLLKAFPVSATDSLCNCCSCYIVIVVVVVVTGRTAVQLCSEPQIVNFLSKSLHISTVDLPTRKSQQVCSMLDKQMIFAWATSPNDIEKLFLKLQVCENSRSCILKDCTFYVCKHCLWTWLALLCFVHKQKGTEKP